MKISVPLAALFIVITFSTSLMLWDYALLQPTAALSLLPGFYSGLFCLLALAHSYNLIKMLTTKD